MMRSNNIKNGKHGRRKDLIPKNLAIKWKLIKKSAR
jgi:hypothetical protein